MLWSRGSIFIELIFPNVSAALCTGVSYQSVYSKSILFPLAHVFSFFSFFFVLSAFGIVQIGNKVIICNYPIRLFWRGQSQLGIYPYIRKYSKLWPRRRQRRHNHRVRRTTRIFTELEYIRTAQANTKLPPSGQADARKFGHLVATDMRIRRQQPNGQSGRRRSDVDD